MKYKVLKASLLLSICLSGVTATAKKRNNEHHDRNNTHSKKKSDRLVGVWSGSAFRAESPLPRPIVVRFQEDGTLDLISGSVLVPLGFDDRSSFLGQWQFIRKEGNKRFYDGELEELLYSGGLCVGRFLVVLKDFVLTCGGKNNECDDTINMDFRFRITRFEFENCDPTQAITDEVTVAEDLVGGTTLFEAVRFLTDPFYCEAGIDICPPPGVDTCPPLSQ